MTLRFGTDGVRGVANRDLTPELLVGFARAVASVLGTDRPYVVGRDTRRSGPSVEAALVAGLTSAGADVELVGVLPTPGIAFRASENGAPALVISASHNPASDNGVKVFAAGGRKLADADEAAIEAALAAGVDARPEGDRIGTVTSAPEAHGRYVLHLMAATQGRRAEGLHVIVDAANGAASDVGPSAIVETGARVDAIHDRPDGSNINDACGSTHPDRLREEVVARGADLGLALDGDADRVLAVDETGRLVDGDELLAILALDRLARGALPGDAVVATVMSNLGLRRALTAHGVDLVETPVGDRNVLDALDERGLALGGEQSGHIIVADLASTGDGLLTGILLLDVLARTGRTLSDLASVVERVPQILENVAVEDPIATAVDEAFMAEVRAIEKELGDDGRVLVRPSGTEPLLRIMVEATDEARARACVARLTDAAKPEDLC